MNKNGFTLAEVLITLGVIGVVSAITMPTLIKNYQKQVTVNKLKKVYTTVSQAYEHSKLDNGEYINWGITTDSNPKEYVQKFWTPYLKTLKECNTYQDCGYDKSMPWVDLQGEVSHEAVTGTAVRHALILSDGTVLSFRIPPVNQGINSAKINIDINGAQGPNMACRDYFWLEITSEGKLRPLKPDDVPDASTCFDKIMQDGWKIKDDYPW